MKLKRLRNLSLETSKTLSHLNLKYVKDIFYKGKNLTHRPFNIKANQNIATKCGN